MSRRDTILVAVLINTGLLALLFMIAINPEEEQLLNSVNSGQQFVEVERKENAENELSSLSFTKSAVEDELDKALQEYAEKISTQKSLPIPTKVEDKLDKALQEYAEKISTQKSLPIPTKDEPKYLEVTVKRGDFLEKIAKQNGTTVSEIKKLNHLLNEHLNIGQILKVPLAHHQKKSEVELKKKMEIDQEIKFYTIKEGDNPWKIAKNFNVRFDELLHLNNLNEEKARKLRAGDKIRVN